MDDVFSQLNQLKLSIHKTNGGLGFKDLSAFNLAMLGKQGWKFLTEPQSLVSRIFKARHFPSKSYLDATVGHNPSFVWRSILRAGFIVRGGARWTIGSGADIPILDAPWLSHGDCIDGNIIGSHYIRDFKVQSLLSDHRKGWNVPLIRQVFSNDVADRILNTPLFKQVQHDHLIWKAENNGCYLVKSVYRLCVEELIDVSHLRRPGNWKDIWRLKVPPKIKHLLWLMCRGCLPTRIRLQDKCVSCPTMCASCNSNHEDLNNIFFECPFAIQVWKSAGMWFDVQHAAMQTDSAVEAIFYLLRNLSVKLNQRFAALCWSLRKHRNLKIWEDVTEISAAVVDRAWVLIDDWQEANAPQPNVHSAAVQQRMSQQVAGQQLPSVMVQQTMLQQHNAHISTAVQQWKPPSLGRFKCNVDTAFLEQFQRTGIGVCLRDDTGTFRRQANAAAHALAGEVISLSSPTIYYVIPSCIESIIINEML